MARIDCISTDCHHMETLKSLFYNGRHYHLCVFFALQYARGLPPGLRENADMTFLFRLHSISQVEACCENFLGHWSKNVGREIMDTCVWQDKETQQRQAICIDQSGRSPIPESVKVVQPLDVPDFILGAREFWGYETPPEPKAKT